MNTTNIKNKTKNISPIDPKSDIAFKKIFGNDLHSHILVSLLNSILFPYATHKSELITQITIKPPSLEGDHVNEKIPVLDIRAETNFKHIINIEMQIKNEYNVLSRSLYYGSRLIGSQLAKRQKYHTLKDSVVIFILDFVIFDEEPDFHNIYLLKNQATNSTLTKLLQFHYIELPKYNQYKSIYPDKINPHLEAWVLFFINNYKSMEELEMYKKTRPEIKEAVELLHQLNSDPDVVDAYDHSLKVELHNNSILWQAQIDGMEKGMEKGKLEGAKLQKQQIVLNLIKIGTDIKTIATVTELTESKIQEIIENQA